MEEYKQLNLYGDDMERFKAQGGTPEELKKEAILEINIRKFIAEKEEKKIIKRENELSAYQIIELAKKFIGDSKEEDFYTVKKILIKTLLDPDKKYNLSPAVMRAEVGEKDGTLLKPEIKQDQEGGVAEAMPEVDEEDDLKRKRDKLPPHQRGISNEDLKNM
jgi:hypothetical protein